MRISTADMRNRCTPMPRRHGPQRTGVPHVLTLAGFGALLPDEVDWQPFPAFPSSVRLAILVGRPAEKGLYTVRVTVPSGVKLMPHRHPEDRVYTVISGAFYIGLGDRFVASQLRVYPPGSVIVLPGNTAHFHWARSGEYVTQVTGMGPLGIDYVNLADDPRSKQEPSGR